MIANNRIHRITQNYVMDERYYHRRVNHRRWILWRYCRSTVVAGMLCLLCLNIQTVDASPQKSYSFVMFHDPPKPLDVWLRPVQVADDVSRPASWQTKSFGQWCRNMTIDRHMQCPEASPFHWFVCCGEHNTECCIGIQTWAYIVFGAPLLVVLLFFGFYLSLQLNLLCPVNAVFNDDSISAKKMKTNRTKRTMCVAERHCCGNCRGGDTPSSPSTSALLRYSSCGAVTATMSAWAAESSPHSSSSSAYIFTGNGSAPLSPVPPRSLTASPTPSTAVSYI